MSKISEAVLEIREMDEEASAPFWLQRLHPLSKLLLTILYILSLVSFSKYALPAILMMGVYPISLMMIGDLSFAKLWKRMKPFFALAFLFGIINPFFDREVLFQLGNVPVTGGIISMISLFIKGAFAITASYILVVTSSMNGICYALRCLHCPKVLVTIIMLIYRYIFVLFQEADRMMQAYSLRAPGQKGLHISVWGSMIGQLLLRSMDMAEVVYESMRLRGFQGEYLYFRREKMKGKDILFLLGWGLFFVLIHFIM